MNMQPMITELRYSAQTSDWIDVLCYYCRRAASIDQKFARQINRLRGEMAVACENRMTLVEELEDVRGIIAPAKAAKFLKETQLKDDAKMEQLQDLERQMELRAVEKELFVQKLLRNVPF
ncbi:hypothetical protein Tco_0471112 [Tanacetum coccineum]